MTKYYSLPLDQTSLVIHRVEVEVTFKGVDPDEDAEDNDTGYFNRNYEYLVPGFEHMDLWNEIHNYIMEDDSELDYKDMYIEHVTLEKPDPDDELWQERLASETNPEDVFYKDGRLYVTDVTYVLFSDTLSFYIMKDTSDKELLEIAKEEELNLQIHN